MKGTKLFVGATIGAVSAVALASGGVQGVASGGAKKNVTVEHVGATVGELLVLDNLSDDQRIELTKALEQLKIQIKDWKKYESSSQPSRCVSADE